MFEKKYLAFVTDTNFYAMTTCNQLYAINKSNIESLVVYNFKPNHNLVQHGVYQLPSSQETADSYIQFIQENVRQCRVTSRECRYPLKNVFPGFSRGDNEQFLLPQQLHVECSSLFPLHLFPRCNTQSPAG